MSTQKTILSNEWLVEEHSDYLFQFAMSKVKNRELSLDFVQETFITCLEKIHQFEGRSSLRTWMTTILHRKILDHWRKGKGSFETMSIDASQTSFMAGLNANSPLNPEELSLEQEKKMALEMCIDKLPDNQRQILIAKYYEEKNGEEISKEFDITSSNFWVIIHRAKAQLRLCMEKHFLS